MGFYLLDHPNPRGSNFYPQRNAELKHIVLHITAGLQDLDLAGVDHSAEATARYAATTDRQVSWHAGCDSDSFLYLLPTSYTAFHCKGFNATGYGLEISKQDTGWADEPAAWVEATLRNAARALAPIVDEHDIPLRRISRLQAAAGHEGFLYHSDADPLRRQDPGVDFPLERLFQLIREELGVKPSPAPTPKPAPAPAKPAPTQKDEDDMAFPIVKRGSSGQDVRNVQALLLARGRKVAIDGSFGPMTEKTLRDWQRAAGLKADGIAGPLTFRTLLGV